MITIGRPSTKARRIVTKDGAERQFFARTSDEPVRLTRGFLDGTFCRDRGRKLVVTLQDGDLLELRPHGTQHALRASLFDIYHWMIRSIANAEKMAKLRDIKAKKELARAERRLRRPLK